VRLKLVAATFIVIGLALPVDVVKAGLTLDFGVRYNDACAEEGFCTNFINSYCGGKLGKKKIGGT
jgi:hypothetical protein